MPSSTRSPKRLRHHYEIERELASKLRTSSRKERAALFMSLYSELFDRVTDHPRLTRRETLEESKANVDKQFRLIAPHLRKEMTLLEIAPGDCRLSLEACKHCTKVIGVDISDQRNPKENFPENFDLIVYDGYKLSQTLDASIDIIFSYQFLEHLHPDDISDHIQLAFRLLKPGGLYILDTPHRFSGPHDISRHFSDDLDCFHFQEWTFGDLRQIFQANGFTKVWAYRLEKVRKHPFVTFATLVTETLVGILPRSLRHLISRRLFTSVTVMAKK